MLWAIVSVLNSYIVDNVNILWITWIPWQPVVIAGMTVALYAQTLKFGYVSDDLLSEARRNTDIANEKALKEGKIKEYKKMVSPEERIWASSTSGNVKKDHAWNIFVHTTCSVLIYYAMGQTQAALFAALLFSANPVNNQGAVWISGRHYAWCGLFLMAAKASGWLGLPAMIAATIHPTAFFAPIGFVGSGQWYLVLFLPVVWFLYFKRLKKEVKTRRGAEVVTFDRKLSWAKIIIAIKIYGWYFFLCLIPWSLTWYHTFMQSGAGAGNEIMAERAKKLDWCFWLGISMIGYLIYSALFNWTLTSWGVFWYSCAIAPYLNLFRMQQEIAERYVYVANIGVMFALATVAPLVVFAFFLGGYIARLLKYLPAYIDDYWLIERSLMEDQHAWFCWFVRAHKRWQQQSYREALNCWVMAKMLSPKEFKILYNIAIVLRHLGKKEESIQHMELAMQNVVKGQEKYAENLQKDYKRGVYNLVH